MTVSGGEIAGICVAAVLILGCIIPLICCYCLFCCACCAGTAQGIRDIVARKDKQKEMKASTDDGTVELGTVDSPVPPANRNYQVHMENGTLVTNDAQGNVTTTVYKNGKVVKVTVVNNSKCSGGSKESTSKSGPSKTGAADDE